MPFASSTSASNRLDYSGTYGGAVSIVVRRYYRTGLPGTPPCRGVTTAEPCLQSFLLNPSRVGYFMAPILKATEAPVANSTATTSSAPHTKPPSEAHARTQPVALEIPVTVNGARTADGSDKRVPFSESTQTVLVLPHGAVVRIAAPLASGQLVFLTNEKTKKEVVCQVVKSKSTGGAAAYVELQFTEPSPGFWGLQVPAVSPAANPVHRPAAPVPSGIAKPVAPDPTVARPSMAARPTPAAPAVPVAKPVVPVAPPTPVHQDPVVANSEPVSPAHIAAESSKHFPVSAFSSHSAEPVRPAAPAESEIKLPDPTSAASTATAPPETAHHPIPAPPLRDYSKEIDALFASPQTPNEPAPQSQTTRTIGAPTTDDLKLQAARLQAQLSSMLFTETPAASKNAAPGGAKPAAPTAVTPIDKPVVPAKKPASIGLDEEVKVPSWLAPLSQNSQGVSAEPAEPPADSGDPPASVNSEESFDALATEAPKRSATAVFGGQLLGEAASTGTKESKKGLFIGLAAAVVLVLAAGGWYYHQNYSLPASASAAGTTSPEASASAPTTTAPATPAGSSPVTEEVHSAPVVPSKSSKRSAGAPAVATPPPAAEHRNARPAAKTAEPVPAPATQSPALADVHLAAPIVNHSTPSQQIGEAVPSIDTKGVSEGSDPFAVAGRHTPPTAPLPIGGDVKPAQLIKSVPPEYPEMAKAQHVSGKVQIDALVDASGNVASVKVLSGPMLLRKAALDAVKQWKYSPARLDDQPTSMHLTVTVEFRGQ